VRNVQYEIEWMISEGLDGTILNGTEWIVSGIVIDMKIANSGRSLRCLPNKQIHKESIGM
jgi:hypothetical protein